MCSNKLSKISMAMAAWSLLILGVIFNAHARTYDIEATTDDHVDDDICELREAIIAANTNAGYQGCFAGDADETDVINLHEGTYLLTREGVDENSGHTGDLDVRDNLMINGVTAEETLININEIDRGFDVGIADEEIIFRLSHVSVLGALAEGQNGGAIRNGLNATVILEHVSIVNNRALNGGGIFNLGELIVHHSTLGFNQVEGNGGGLVHLGIEAVFTHSTISSNGANGDGGGIASNGLMNLNNTTIADNVSDEDGDGFGIGGGINTTPDTVFIRNTAIANNSDNTGIAPDCFGSLFSDAYNIITDTTECELIGDNTGNQLNVEALFGELGENGGTTLTNVPLGDNPAIDGANPNGCKDHDATTLILDQRHFPVPIDGDNDGEDVCDVGAVEVECGNGVLEGEETCDDGNLEDDDDCPSSCIAPICGDGIVNQDDEECDDGNENDSDSCHHCILATCGDDIVREGVEQCDDGNDVVTDDCVNCANPSCGDNFVQDGVEECDDGNDSDSDSCHNCLRNFCGDGILWEGVEQCDDGNLEPADGCSDECTTEVQECGNGIVEEGEECDDGDGDTIFTDACHNCRNNVCGDNTVFEGVEECDDGNDIDTDDCHHCLNNICGDDAVNIGVEECDDGNTDSGDGCDANCEIEQDNGVPDGENGNGDNGDTDNGDTDDIPDCGNGIVEADEQCDDSNDDSGDGCSSSCQLESDSTDTSTTPDASQSASGGGCSLNPEVPISTSSASGAFLLMALLSLSILRNRKADGTK